MDLDELIIYLQKLQSEGKGKYKTLANNIDYNTASGGSYVINENSNLSSCEIIVNEDEHTIAFGDYNEYYSY